MAKTKVNRSILNKNWRIYKGDRWPMIKDIHIQIPTTTTLKISQAQLMAYSEIRPLRERFPRNAGTSSRTVRHGWANTQAGIEGDYNVLLEFAKDHQVYEIVFPTDKWNDLLYRKNEHLANPSNKVALFFIGSKNFNLITGHPAGTEMFMINNDLYRKITWRSLGVKNERKAVKYDEDGRLISFLHKCNRVNQEPLRSQITDGIGVELMRRDEKEARNKIEAQEGIALGERR